MKSCTTILAFCLLVLLHMGNCQVTEEEMRESQRKYADLMKHDGKKRVKLIDGNNIKTLMKKNDIIVIYFWIDNDKETEKMTDQDMQFLETVAQAAERRGIVIGTCEVMKNKDFAVRAELRYTGMIKIFNRGKIQTYGGQRSAEVLIAYLYKMKTTSVMELSKKVEKKSFDQLDYIKVIAYVKKNSKEYEAFVESSYLFQPMIFFFVVSDPKIAKIFHLKKVNSIQIVKPYEKSVNFPNKEKLTYESITKFITENKRERLTKLRLENLHEIWAIDMKGYLVPIFANVNSEGGASFFSKCKKLSKQHETNNNLTFVWIEPEPFPAMVEYWRKSFDIDPLKPNLGVIDIHTQKSVWFEIDRDEEDFSQYEAMGKWLKSVLKGDIEFQPMKTMEDIKEEEKPPQKEGEDNVDDAEEGEEERDEL